MPPGFNKLRLVGTLSQHGEMVRQGKERASEGSGKESDDAHQTTVNMRGRSSAGWNTCLSRRRPRVRVPSLPPKLPRSRNVANA